jgi:hypothetical protein
MVAAIDQDSRTGNRERRHPMNKKRERLRDQQKGPDPTRGRASRKNYKSIFVKGVVGKTIASFEQIIMNEEGGWNLEISFTDGTVLVFDMVARLEVTAQILKQEDGTLKPVRNYGKRAR